MTRHYVSFSAPVNPMTAQTLQGLCANLVSKGASEICLLLSTPGGSVTNGITIHNFLRGLPTKLITHNIGNVDSIGNIVFLAGEERLCCPNASFMFHGVGFDVPQQTRLEEKLLRERLDSLQADQRKIGAIIAGRTGMTAEEVAESFLEAKTRDPDYALDKGIIHRIADVEIPAGAPIHQLVFK